MTVIPFPQTASPCKACATAPRRQRLQLPVASRDFARSRFAPAGKPMPALLPVEAMAWLDGAFSQEAEIETVELSGPGDPLAAPGPSLDTLQLLKEKYPELPVRLTTLGIGGSLLAESLAGQGLKAVTVKVDTVDPTTAERLFSWIRPSTRTVPLPKAAAILVDEQAKAVAAFTKAGMAVTVRTTLYPGINDGEVEAIAVAMARQGAVAMDLVPFVPPAKENDFPPAADQELLARAGALAGGHLAIVKETMNLVTMSPHGATGAGPARLPRPSAERPNVAVVSSNGMEVDLHLGHAIRVLVYGPREDGLACLLGTRPAPEPGSGASRWETLAETLTDCFCLLTASAGNAPRQILADHGITVLITEGDIEGTVDVLYGGGKKGKKNR